MNIRAKIFGGGKPGDESPVVQSKKPKGARPDGLHAVPVKRDETRKADTRDEDRHRLPDEQVRVTCAGLDHEVQLINLSGGGAMVAGDFAAKLWDRLQLHLGENGTIDCAVRWIKGDRVGLEFAHETRLDCAADKQADVLRQVIARSFPDIEFEVSSEPQPAPADFDEEQRTDRRHPLIWSGVIHHDYQSTPVRLRNISSTGAMIDCGTPLRAGSELLLELGDSVQVFSTVAWVFGDAAGLRFDKPFDLALLARSRPEVTSAKSQRPDYLQSGAPAADTPWDEQWDRMSLGELKQSLEGFMKR
jgi:hypothetical protein